MGLATLIGGMGTAIGTSTNLLVVSVAADMGMARFGMFDFVLPVVIAGGAAILYLWLIAPRLIPDRNPPMAYKTNLLVMNAGGDKFSDFIKVGTPLALLMWVSLSAVLAIFYQL